MSRPADQAVRSSVRPSVCLAARSPARSLAGQTFGPPNLGPERLEATMELARTEPHLRACVCVVRLMDAPGECKVWAQNQLLFAAGLSWPSGRASWSVNWPSAGRHCSRRMAAAKWSSGAARMKVAASSARAPPARRLVACSRAMIDRREFVRLAAPQSARRPAKPATRPSVCLSREPASGGRGAQRQKDEAKQRRRRPENMQLRGRLFWLARLLDRPIEFISSRRAS